MNRNQQLGPGRDSLQFWWNDMPMVTKTFLVGMVGLAGLTHFRVVSPDRLLLIWPYITERKELWRLVTTFFYAGNFSFNFILHVLVFYENCRRYEMNPINTGAGGNSADFLWMMMISMGFLLALGYLFDLYLLTEPLSYAIIYLWSRRAPDSMVSFFGLTFKALYLPWFYIAIRLVMGGEVTEPLVGIGVGHVYYSLVETVPSYLGFRVIKTPKFCTEIVRYVTGLTPVGPAAPEPINVNQFFRNQQQQQQQQQQGGFPAPGAVPPPREPVPSVPSAPPQPQPQQQPQPQPAGNEHPQQPEDSTLRYRGSSSSGGASNPNQSGQQQQQQQQQQQGGGYNWGRGRTLGGN